MSATAWHIPVHRPSHVLCFPQKEEKDFSLSASKEPDGASPAPTERFLKLTSLHE